MSMEQGRFGMKDRDFFADPEAGLARGVQSLMQESFRGIAMEAPRAVSPTEHDKCLVLLAQIDLARKLVQSPVTSQGVLVATDLKRHRTYSARAVEQRSQDDEGPLELPSATQVSAQSFQVDLRARLGLPWDRGDLRVQVVSRDQVSNRVAISLGAPEGSYRDPVAEEFVESQWARRQPPPVHPRPGIPLPSYAKTPNSPAIPEAPYLSISVPRLVQAQTGTAVVIYGSFRVPSSAVQIVQAEHRESYQEPIPNGIVTVALVLTGSEVVGPEQMNLHIPVFGQAEALEAGGQYTGYFALDLAAHLSLFARAQTWFLYASCDEILAGPIPIAVVTPDQLPDPNRR
jgi:hypothetical protein